MERTPAATSLPRTTGGHGTDEQLWNVEKAAYAKGKVDAEKYGNAWGEETGIDVVSNMPAMVLNRAWPMSRASMTFHRKPGAPPSRAAIACPKATPGLSLDQVDALVNSNPEQDRGRRRAQRLRGRWAGLERQGRGHGQGNQLGLVAAAAEHGQLLLGNRQITAHWYGSPNVNTQLTDDTLNAMIDAAMAAPDHATLVRPGDISPGARTTSGQPGPRGCASARW